MLVGFILLAGDSEVDILLFFDIVGVIFRVEVVEVLLFLVDIFIYFLFVSLKRNKKLDVYCEISLIWLKLDFRFVF